MKTLVENEIIKLDTENLIDVRAEPEKLLICAIIDQALYDYRTLRDEHINKKRDNSSTYSKGEIENFLNSNWCSELMEFLDTPLSGKDIIHKLKTESISESRRCLNFQRHS